MKNKLVTALGLILLPSVAQISNAGSASWKVSPKDSNWNNPTNWRQITVPNGPNDIATFDRSFNPGLYIYNAFIQVNEIAFRAGANSYNIGISNGVFEISGTGVTNNSSVRQSFAAVAAGFASKFGEIIFINSATAGRAFYIVGGYSSGDWNGEVDFDDSSSAGDATFDIRGNPAGEPWTNGGFVGFHNNSSAGNASFFLGGNPVAANLAGHVTFYDSATIGNANFTVNGGETVSGANGATLYAGSLAPEQGNATFTINGGAASGAQGGYMKFQPAVASNGTWKVTVNGGAVDGALGGTFECDNFDAGESIYRVNGGTGNGAAGGLLYFNNTAGVRGTLIASGGTNGGAGGSIQISSSYSGASPAVQVFRNGTLDVTLWSSPSVTSLDGNGIVALGSQNLSIGVMDVSSSFGGSINGAGGVTKVGTGTVTFSGANKYTGQTIVSDGMLLVNNTYGSGTGAGSLSVNSGGIGGTGIIHGMINVGHRQRHRCFSCAGR